MVENELNHKSPWDREDTRTLLGQTTVSYVGCSYLRDLEAVPSFALARGNVGIGKNLPRGMVEESPPRGEKPTGFGGTRALHMIMKPLVLAFVFEWGLFKYRSGIFVLIRREPGASFL